MKEYSKKKNWKLELILFIAFMIGLMINDAMNHPEDFIRGYSIVNPK